MSSNQLNNIEKYGPVGYISALMIAFVLTADLSAVHLDLTRDSRVALDILGGKSLPFEGPLLAGHVHLGPVWFYLLAGLFLIGDNWIGAIKWLFLLASAQFPFAYLAGKSLRDRTTGVLWATFLFVPSWSLFEQVLPTHTLLTAPAALGTLYFLARTLREGDVKHLVAAGAFFSFALHAHPSTLILLPPFLWVCYRSLARRIVTPLSGIAIAGASSALFFPLVAAYFLSGTSPVEMLKAYSHSGQFEASLAGLPLLVWESSVGGLYYLLTGLLGLGTMAALAFVLPFGLLIGLGLSTVLNRAFRRDPVCMAVTGTLIFGTLLATALRTTHPYYMTTALRVVLFGGAALGISYLAVSVGSTIRKISGVISAACIGVTASIWVAIGQWQSYGDWPIAVLPLFDVKSPRQPPQQLTMMSAEAMDSSGAWLCKSDLVGLHGPLGVHLIQSYGLAMQLTCPLHTEAMAGGGANRQRWIGISSRMAERLDVTPQIRIGAFAISSVRRSLNSLAAIAAPSRAGYPPISSPPANREALTIETSIAPQEHLAITNFAWLFAPNPTISVTVSGRSIQPSAADWMTTIYACDSCTSERVQVRIENADPRLIDVVIF